MQHRLNYQIRFDVPLMFRSSSQKPGSTSGPAPLGWLLAPAELSAEKLTDCKLYVEMAGIRAQSSAGGRCVGRTE